MYPDRTLATSNHPLNPDARKILALWRDTLAAPQMAGYSGTPLPKKLGLKAGMTLVAIELPNEYRSWLGEIPADLTIVATSKKQIEAAHIFATKKAILKKHLVAFRRRLEQGGFVWVSWPKKASKVETDITEDVIRELALPLGLVDVKVCAVNDVWSGLKLVIRKSERAA